MNAGETPEYLRGVRTLPKRLGTLLDANDEGMQLTRQEVELLDRRLADATQRVFEARCRRYGRCPCPSKAPRQKKATVPAAIVSLERALLTYLFP
jgi:hypothetical protein